VVQDIFDRKLTMSFKVDADIIPIEVTDTLDKFFVEGVLTTLSDLKRPGQVIQRQPRGHDRGVLPRPQNG